MLCSRRRRFVSVAWFRRDAIPLRILCRRDHDGAFLCDCISIGIVIGKRRRGGRLNGRYRKRVIGVARIGKGKRISVFRSGIDLSRLKGSLGCRNRVVALKVGIGRSLRYLRKGSRRNNNVSRRNRGRRILQPQIRLRILGDGGKVDGDILRL